MYERRTLLFGLAGLLAGVAIPRAVKAQQATYTYDVHGRLVGVSRTGNQSRYTYDAADNRTQHAPGAAPALAGPLPLGATPSNTDWGGSPLYPDPPIVVTVTGGAGPFTYLWQRVSGSNRVWPTNATGSSTQFSGQPEEFHGFTAVFRCRVTDALGSIAYTSNVIASFGPDQ